MERSKCRSASRGARASAAGVLVGARDGLPPMSTRQLGGLGEDMACMFLEQRGIEVLERNYTCWAGEADIVARDGSAAVLVEVKARRVNSQDTGVFPEEAVDAAKRERYRRIAETYLSEHPEVSSVRFDIVAVILASGDAVRVQHIVGAFEFDGAV